MSMRRLSARSLIIPNGRTESTFLITIKFFLIRESTCVKNECQGNFDLTSLPHHAIELEQEHINVKFLETGGLDHRGKQNGNWRNNLCDNSR